MAISLSTSDKLEYNFYPVTGKQIQFRVKASNDAHVALTTGPQEGEPMYEVFIGGWGNSKSVIRKNRTKPDVAEEATPDVLTADEYRGFWIRWDSNTITVGREGVQEPFLTYSDPESIYVSHFGVCTGWSACGEWLIEADSAPRPSAPAEYQSGTQSWVDSSGGMIPPGAIEGGRDDEALYVGRANHEGALIPGKIKPSHGVCYIPWGGEEHGKIEYQVLVADNTSWVEVTEGNIPSNAIPAGETENGETLFVGRAHHEGTTTIGKIQPSHNVLYIPFGGVEVAFPNFEILVSN